MMMMMMKKLMMMKLKMMGLSGAGWRGGKGGYDKFKNEDTV